MKAVDETVRFVQLPAQLSDTAMLMTQQPWGARPVPNLMFNLRYRLRNLVDESIKRYQQHSGLCDRRFLKHQPILSLIDATLSATPRAPHVINSIASANNWDT